MGQGGVCVLQGNGAQLCVCVFGERNCDVDVVFWLQLICASWSGRLPATVSGTLHEAGEADVRVSETMAVCVC